MVTKRKKSKQLRKLEDGHQYLGKKVAQLTKDRLNVSVICDDPLAILRITAEFNHRAPD